MTDQGTSPPDHAAFGGTAHDGAPSAAVVGGEHSRAPTGFANDASRYTRRPSFAAIDLGTNNCRLLIARPDRDSFVIVDAFSRIVRLGEGLNSSGRISDGAMQRAVDALRICADKIARRRVHLSRAVATEACRQASNGEEFVSRVREATGIALDIISPQEEARLAVMGCHQLIEPGHGPALIFDIGGGSTELVLIDDSGDEPQIVDWASIPWGVVSLTESVAHDSNDQVARALAYQQMRDAVRTAFSAFATRLRGRFADAVIDAPRLLGTSGTVTTLASLYLDLPAYERRAVDGLQVATADMRAICVQLAALSVAEREKLPCVGRERADLVVAGCAVLEEICDIWPTQRLGVADRGIREGVLRQMMRSHDDRRAG